MRSQNASATALVVTEMTDLAAPTDVTICVCPFRFDPDLVVEVPLVRSTDAAARDRRARAGQPCLLVVGATDPAPVHWSELEDWVREGAPRRELVTRAVTVARRADLLHRPRLEHVRAVSFRGRTVVVPDTQAGLVAVLVERFGETVADRTIREVLDREGTSTHDEAVKTALRRLKDTLTPLGLHVARVRAAGYLLDRCD